MGADATIIKRRGRHCTLLYEASDEQDAELVFHKLVRCIPDEGYRLFEVCASYSASRPPSSYYRLGLTPHDVRSQFSAAMPWLRVVGVFEITDEQDAEHVLTDPLRMPG